MNFETDYTDEITCPYCGYEEGDSWEHGDLESTGRVSCGSCGKEFWATRNVAITYSTEKVDWKLDGEKKIDRCSMCSHFEKKLKDYNGFKDYVKRCMKSDKSILVDADDNIEYFCELPVAVEGGECDTDDIKWGGYDNEYWSELHDTD